MSDADIAGVKRENVCTFGLFSRVPEKKNQKTEGRQSSYGITRDQRMPFKRTRDVWTAFDTYLMRFYLHSIYEMNFGLLLEITV
uniref:Uncharacterized protein n=1 Tax=Angiostrongylus cantonensis TaxID=6313 RepID=A0A0K0CU84_ANGCA